MKKLWIVLVLMLAVSLTLAACGGGDAAPSGGGDASAVGDVAAGRELFSQTVLYGQAGCATCHSLVPDQTLVGPSMAGVAVRAETRVPGLDAEAYLRQSILEPDAYVVEGFTPGLMVNVWEETLSETEVDDLVAYMLTLR